MLFNPVSISVAAMASTQLSLLGLPKAESAQSSIYINAGCKEGCK